ncbi:MAG: hypothetical protein C0616_14695 [Desulfuromonas sp.]|nr:MAG: hypothetical protein C0616_14695 [Desulfuromonas sp.]
MDSSDPDRCSTTTQSPEQRILLSILVTALTALLFSLSRVNYPLFHTLVEFASISVSFTLFSIGWNARYVTRNDSFTFLAITFSAVGGIELCHLLTYKGMGIFPNLSSDIPTQFWIACRFLESVSFLLAALLVDRKLHIKAGTVLFLAIAVAVATGLTIWPFRIFPHCLVEGAGLTAFKVSCEYLVCFIFLFAALVFRRKKAHLDPQLLKLLTVAISLNIAAEFAFTLYRDVYGLTNVLGHILNLAATVLVYRALVLGSLRRPYRTLFRDLDQSHQALDQELEQRRLTEAELRATNDELDTFVRAVSHDLRSPLTYVIGSAQLLGSELNERLSTSEKTLIQGIEAQGQSMVNMLEDLLSLSKIGHLEQSPQPIYTQWLAERVIRDLGENPEGNIKIDSMPTLVAHETQIYQLLLNLVKNALTYAKDSARPIEVGGDRQDGEAQFYVRDYGPGIPLEEREKIFEVFHRVDPDSDIPGTGIGLATVKKVADFYRGKAWVEETPGGGATFRVTLQDVG